MIGEVQLAAGMIETQAQLQVIARASELLELEHFHATEAWRQVVDQFAREVHRPLDLNDARQDRRTREMAAEVRQVQRHAQLDLPVIVLPLLLHTLRFARARRQQQSVEFGLGQFALGIAR
ncbi:hypothetical protein A3710_01175 [Stutzerimonas frequens]|nr:hypothetical protein A3710_01175 [Stutzerimonas frequens]